MAARGGRKNYTDKYISLGRGRTKLNPDYDPRKDPDYSGPDPIQGVGKGKSWITPGEQGWVADTFEDQWHQSIYEWHNVDPKTGLPEYVTANQDVELRGGNKWRTTKAGDRIYVDPNRNPFTSGQLQENQANDAKGHYFNTKSGSEFGYWHGGETQNSDKWYKDNPVSNTLSDVAGAAGLNDVVQNTKDVIRDPIGEINQVGKDVLDGIKTTASDIGDPLGIDDVSEDPLRAGINAIGSVFGVPNVYDNTENLVNETIGVLNGPGTPPVPEIPEINIDIPEQHGLFVAPAPIGIGESAPNVAGIGEEFGITKRDSKKGVRSLSRTLGGLNSSSGIGI